MNPLEELCKLVLSITSHTPKLLAFLDIGAVLFGDYFVLPLDSLADEFGVPYYAVNPYTGDIYELYNSFADPETGIKVTDPELISIIYDCLGYMLDGFEEVADLEDKVIVLPPAYRVIPGIGIICLT